MSNTGSKTLTISVMQKEFQVACPEGEEESLLRAARYLSEQMESIRSSGKVVGMDRIAVMAARQTSFLVEYAAPCSLEITARLGQSTH